MSDNATSTAVNTVVIYHFATELSTSAMCESLEKIGVATLPSFSKVFHGQGI